MKQEIFKPGERVMMTAKVLSRITTEWTFVYYEVEIEGAIPGSCAAKLIVREDACAPVK